MSKLLQLRGGTTTEHASFTGAVREVTVDTTKDTLVIHDGSTAGGFALPRTDAEIRTAVEAATDSNVFTDADHSKLNAIEASATADQTDAEIRTAVEAATDSNVFTDADHTKLNAIEAAATADQTKADIDALNINADLLDGQHGAYYTGYTDTAVAGIVDSSPAALNTLNELAAALGDDANFATTTANSIGTKMPLAGGTFTGAVNFTVDSNFADGDKLTFGNSNDLQISHDGTHSYITDVGAGNLDIRTNGARVYIGKTDGENSARFDTDGAVTLYHNNAAKLATTTSGIDVTGTVTTGGTVLDDGAITDTGNFTMDAAGIIILDADADGTIELKDAGAKYGVFYKSSSNLMLYNPISNGDVRFQGNDGGSTVTALTLDMSAAGAATFNNNVTAYSDERLKENIVTVTDALEKVTAMRGVHYNRIDTGKAHTGVVAQEIQKIAPELVLTADDEIGTLSVDYGNITGYLIEAIKELKAEIEELKGK